AIRRAFSEDVYIVMPNYDVASQSINVEIFVNPLINWTWFGFGILALGTVIALLPETVFAFATARVPANAVTTGMLLLALVLWPGLARAQEEHKHVVTPDSAASVKSRTPQERDVGKALMCMCGD